MAMPQKILPHYTLEDWQHWEGVWELIEGHPIAMSPTPVPAHQQVANEIRTELTLALRASNCKHFRAYDPLDYKISDDTIFVPDILIICGEVKKKFLDFPPALVVEILSPATALHDRLTKYQYYEHQGIPYYLIVDTEKKQIEIYNLIEGSYQLLEAASSPQFHLHNDCSITPQLNSVFY